nr:uncharacterized protein LOC107399937 isoform X4 [Peromyscus maniculatus bairdii]XP_042123255.1 uncharacterized protein LOC107399937 isoform X4 [Peromyscus maniculatus bairdii]XP_042123257.1 uncharacterized protein LOC107399937 isoform X4 [Peromyscus maniculatus bairdii]XP_042123261.1 uncharacterized protein LOC107399937 isoform X4 [Peromyscus maniculatus bairdii]
MHLNSSWSVLGGARPRSDRKFHHSLLDCVVRKCMRKTRPGIRGHEISPEPQSPRGAAWESHQSAAQWREPQPGGPGTSQKTQRKAIRRMNSLINAPQKKHTVSTFVLHKVEYIRSVIIKECGCGLLKGGMGISRLCSEGIVHACNAGELQQSSLCGTGPA